MREAFRDTISWQNSRHRLKVHVCTPKLHKYPTMRQVNFPAICRTVTSFSTRECLSAGAGGVRGACRFRPRSGGCRPAAEEWRLTASSWSMWSSACRSRSKLWERFCGDYSTCLVCIYMFEQNMFENRRQAILQTEFALFYSILIQANTAPMH